jgi:hypothetical protein
MKDKLDIMLRLFFYFEKRRTGTCFKLATEDKYIEVDLEPLRLLKKNLNRACANYYYR